MSGSCTSSPVQLPTPTGTDSGTASVRISPSNMFLFPLFGMSSLAYLQDTDCFRKDDFPAYPLPSEECHLVLNRIQFLQGLERQSYTVDDLIALSDISEDDRELAGGEGGEGATLVGHVRHLDNRTTEQ